MGSEDTHITGFGGDVDLGDSDILVDGLLEDKMKFHDELHDSAGCVSCFLIHVAPTVLIRTW